MHNPDPQFLEQAANADSFDVIVVVASPDRAPWWRGRLARTQTSQVVVTEEVWSGLPGNGLGTLLALVEAERQVPDLWARIDAGHSVAVYHTAGRGQRLYPLPAVHGGDKAAVRVPGDLPGVGAPTLLEAVLRQTSPFATLGGDIWVFWGDQLTAPTVRPTLPAADVALLGKVGAIPGPERFAAEGLASYGLVALGGSGGQQLEKLDADAFSAVLPRLSDPDRVAVSMGSFHMRATLARQLLQVFAPELEARTGKADTDPHFWMPMTLPRDLYVDLGHSGAHWDRMQAIDGNLGVVDVGRHAPWWDFGTLTSYRASCMAVRDPTPAAHALRVFLSCPAPMFGSVIVGEPCPAQRSVVVHSHVGSATEGLAIDAKVDGDVAGTAYAAERERVELGMLACDAAGHAFDVAADIDGKAHWSDVVDGAPVSFEALRDLATS